MSTITRGPGRIPEGARRISVEEFSRMNDAAVFGDGHVQLLDGELYEVTKNPPHNYSVDALARALRLLVESIGYLVREEKPIEPWEDWWPEPDISVLNGPIQRYQARHPGPADILLLAEVCENSPQDRTTKLTGYASAGFPQYWILDLHLRCLEVYSDPVAGSYQAQQICNETGAVEVVINGRTLGRIAVADLLPPKNVP